MALKTEKPPEASVVASPMPNTTVLELALYKIYTWGPNTYEKGKPYRFKNSDAMILLAEHDLDRPVWKIYKPERPKQVVKPEIVDATMIAAPIQVDSLGEPLTPVGKLPPKRIDVGTDNEIADILNRPDDSSGDVTV